MKKQTKKQKIIVINTFYSAISTNNTHLFTFSAHHSERKEIDLLHNCHIHILHHTA